MKMGRFILIFTLAGGAIALLIYFLSVSYQVFLQKDATFDKLFQIKTLETELDFEVLQSSFYLYYNYDRIVNKEQELQEAINILSHKLLALENPRIQSILALYTKQLRKKEEMIDHFLRYNSLIKNSLTYIYTLLKKLPSLHITDTRYEKSAIDAIASVVLAKNSLDPELLQQAKEDLRFLRSYRFASTSLNRFNQILVRHLQLVFTNFSIYQRLLHSILQHPTMTTLTRLSSSINRHFHRKITLIERIFELIIFFYIVTLGIIIFFFFKLDRENRLLQNLQRKLQKQAIEDPLTKLYNRKAFKQDVRKVKKPLFALINIDHFTHYNDFYGVRMGDHILRECAKILKKIASSYNARVYRIGGDEFGILIDEQKSIDEKLLAQTIMSAFKEHPISFKGIVVTPSVSIAITRKRPLLENADVTMRYLKKEHRGKFLVFNENLPFLQEIKINFQKSKILQDALKNDRIQPYFQAIVDNKTTRPIKYETLARLIHPDGKVESIFSYLPIAKEMGLSHLLTRQIMQKALVKAIKAKKPISVNLSMQDIDDPEFYEFLKDIFKNYPQASSLLSFELLESETLKDYKAVKQFIDFCHQQGCEVGIDDFGSGYSNFAHIFNLNVDFIKIDGSLIKDLDQNPKAHIILTHILSLAHTLGIKVVAEYVASKEIFEQVKALGVEYSQGFYFHKPQPSL